MDEEHIFFEDMFDWSINYRHLMQRNIFFVLQLIWAMREKLQREGRKGASWETERIQFVASGSQCDQ